MPPATTPACSSSSGDARTASERRAENAAEPTPLYAYSDWITTSGWSPASASRSPGPPVRITPPPGTDRRRHDDGIDGGVGARGAEQRSGEPAGVGLLVALTAGIASQQVTNGADGAFDRPSVSLPFAAEQTVVAARDLEHVGIVAQPLVERVARHKFDRAAKKLRQLIGELFDVPAKTRSWLFRSRLRSIPAPGPRTSDVVVVTDPPTLTCANAGPAGAGYALGTLAAALHCRFQGSQVPVFELFSRGRLDERGREMAVVSAAQRLGRSSRDGQGVSF